MEGDVVDSFRFKVVGDKTGRVYGIREIPPENYYFLVHPDFERASMPMVRGGDIPRDLVERGKIADYWRKPGLVIELEDVTLLHERSSRRAA